MSDFEIFEIFPKTVQEKLNNFYDFTTVSFFFLLTCAVPVTVHTVNYINKSVKFMSRARTGN